MRCGGGERYRRYCRCNPGRESGIKPVHEHASEDNFFEKGRKDYRDDKNQDARNDAEVEAGRLGASAARA